MILKVCVRDSNDCLAREVFVCCVVSMYTSGRSIFSSSRVCVHISGDDLTDDDSSDAATLSSKFKEGITICLVTRSVSISYIYFTLCVLSKMFTVAL